MKKNIVLAAAVAAIAAFMPRVQAGQPRHVMRFNHVNTEAEPYHKAWESWAEAVNKRTGGDVEIQVFHSAQLGAEEDVIEQMRMGAPLGQASDPARMGNYVREFSVMNLPYFVDTLEEIEKLYSLPAIKEWQRRLEDEQGIHIFALNYVQGFRHVYANIPVRSPADLKGIRIRSAPAQAWQALVRSLGATPVTIPFVDVYSAVQTKAVDGTESGYVPGYHGSYYEVCKFVSETRHLLQMNVCITSAEWFRSLPGDYQKIIDEECQKAGKSVSAEIVNVLSRDYRKKFQEKGVTVVDDVDLGAFRAASDSAYAELNLLEARDRIHRELGKK